VERIFDRSNPNLTHYHPTRQRPHNHRRQAVSVAYVGLICPLPDGVGCELPTNHPSTDGLNSWRRRRRVADPARHSEEKTCSAACWEQRIIHCGSWENRGRMSGSTGGWMDGQRTPTNLNGSKGWRGPPPRRKMDSRAAASTYYCYSSISKLLLLLIFYLYFIILLI
jgi:hypothetical protein